jgi:hypothetical protein
MLFLLFVVVEYNTKEQQNTRHHGRQTQQDQRSTINDLENVAVGL